MRALQVMLLASGVFAIFTSAVMTPATSQTTLTEIQRITVLDSFTYPTSGSYTQGVAIDYWGGSLLSVPRFYFNFEPKQTYLGVSHIYVNGIWASTTSADFTVRYEFSNTPTFTGLVTDTQNKPRAFNHNAAISTINVGMNQLTITRSTQPTDSLWLCRLELFIEYQYQETTSPPMSEVTSTELLMWLGYGIAISYIIYSKLKPRFRKPNKMNQTSLNTNT